MASITGEEIINEIPEPVAGELHEVILGSGGISEDDYVLCLRVDFSVEQIDLRGYIAFLMDIQSLDIFRKKLAEYFGIARTA
jgi:chemotaxis protein CheC